MLELCRLTVDPGVARFAPLFANRFSRHLEHFMLSPRVVTAADSSSQIGTI
jgi:hypothetical protein